MDVVEYVVVGISTFLVWVTKRIYDLDKKIALNTQNDETVRVALSEFKKSIEDLTKQVGEMRILIAEEFGQRKKAKDA